MIRFNCPGCKKVLNWPDDKAGVRLPCPGCKQVVQVPAPDAAAKPASTATPGSGPGPTTASVPATPSSGPKPTPPEPAKSFGQRFVAESGAVALATFLQTIRPISYVFSLRRRNKLAPQGCPCGVALGQRMYELKIGDKKLAGKIQELGERVHNIEAVRGDVAKPPPSARG